jgi:hypothetical protein
LPQRSLLRMSTAKTSCTTRRSSHSCGSTVVRRRASSRRRPAALGESPALGQPPRSPGGGAASMAAHAGVAAHWGVRTRPCAGQPAPLPGVLARGVDAVPSLCGPPCRGPAPAGVAFGRQRARARRHQAPRQRRRGGEGLCWPRAEEGLARTLPRPQSASGGHGRAVLVGAIRAGPGSWVPIHAETAWARRRRGARRAWAGDVATSGGTGCGPFTRGTSGGNLPPLEAIMSRPQSRRHNDAGRTICRHCLP